MKAKLLYLLLTFSLFQSNLSAQFCGLSAADAALLSSNFHTKFNPLAYSDATVYVPVSFIRVAKSNGTGRLSDADILRVLCLLNAQYASTEIQFYLSPHPSGSLFGVNVDSDVLVYGSSNLNDYTAYRHPNALNIVVLSQIQANPTLSGVYSPAVDMVFMRKDAILTANIVAHEIGHFLSLLHTYSGWEYSTTINLTSFYPLAPFFLPNGAETELMGGSNCTTAGDKICDTPPDYPYDGNGVQICTYNGEWKDANGVLINPMPQNMMSYRVGCTNWEFTDGQVLAMKTDLLHPNRAYLQQNTPPNLLNIDVQPGLLISPADGSVPNNTTVEFKWKSVVGASHYLFLVDVIPNFLSQAAHTVHTDATTLSLTLEKNRHYYWRVLPYNVLGSCAISDPDSELRTFYTNDLLTVGKIDGLNEIEGFISQDMLHINASASEYLNLTARLTDSNSRQVTEFLNISLQSGQNQLQFPLNVSLPTGIYFLNMVGENGKRVALRLFVEG